MAVTTPDNIVTPDDGDDYALVQDLGALADSVQEAITDWKNYGIGTDAERLALTGSSNPPLKDGLLWYSTNTDTLWVYEGSTWKILSSSWRSYTPSTTNVTGGAITAEYAVVNGVVFVRLRHALSGANFSGQPIYSLPVTASFPGTRFLKAGATADDASGSEYPLVLRLQNSTTVAPYVQAVVSSQVQFANISSTVPFTWANGDVLELEFEYRAA
jgi:hypothetical protein